MEDCNRYTYSIIIPHKNIANLLQRCLDSIPFREDVQIIVIDDNSDPDIVDFEHFPGINRPFTEICLTKKGKGAGYARNIGLQHARGKWLLFVDADDFLVADALEKMDKYANSNSDIVYFRLVDDMISSKLIPNPSDIIDVKRAKLYNAALGKETKMLLLEHNIPVGKMISRRCVEKNRLFFDEVPCSNDIMFFTKLAFCVENIEISSEYLYCISKPLGHNLTSRKDFSSGKVRLQVLLARNQLLQEYGFNYMLTPPLIMVWKFRHLGVKAILSYCWLIIRSTTPIFTGMSKFLRSPMAYLKNN